MSTIAVFMMLGGATAIAARSILPKNSVGTKQLKKNAVSTAKLKKNAVSTAKLKKNAVTSAKVKDGSLLGADFAAGQLPAGPKGDAGPVGPTFGVSVEGGCGNLGVAFEDCPSTGPVNLPAAGRVLLVASASWDNDNDGIEPNAGSCRLSVDGNPLDPTINFGENTNTHTLGESGSISMNSVTPALPAGVHTFALECAENDPTVFIDQAMLSAVLLGGA